MSHIYTATKRETLSVSTTALEYALTALWHRIDRAFKYRAGDDWWRKETFEAIAAYREINAKLSPSYAKRHKAYLKRMAHRADRRLHDEQVKLTGRPLNNWVVENGLADLNSLAA